LVAHEAQAEDDETTKEARRLYNEAREAMSAKNYKEAALNFEAASRLRPHAVALYTAAQAWELAGEPARAADAYAKALATPKLNDTQATRSRERLAALEKETGVVVALGPETTRVQLDDQMESGLPARLHGSPGAHVVTIIFADGNSETRNVTLEKGGSVELDTTRSATPEEAAPPKKDKVVPMSEPKTEAVRVEPEPTSVWKTVGFIATGAGLATLAGGAVLGLAAKDAEDTYKAAPTQETLDHAKGLESNTNILFITGGVLTAAGIGLVVWQSMSKGSKPAEQDVALVIKPSGLFAEGSF
jgi:tetratricopeptide (TPR) repeat protein